MFDFQNLEVYKKPGYFILIVNLWSQLTNLIIT